MTKPFENYIEKRVQNFNIKLENLLQNLEAPSQLKDSMKYSITAGGKRIRPVLVMASYEAFKTDIEKTYTIASALEMIHTYSLIHDDLPAMDDDDYRRGSPTNHKKFDEATAILAGDALLTYAFEIITDDMNLNIEEKLYAISKLSKASGPEGMIAGQILDIEAESKNVNLDELVTIHSKKTGALINFAVHLGAYLAGATREQLYYLDEYASNIGLLFQVQDDILDIIGDEDKIGKPVGSDEELDKSTYPNLLGLKGAKKYRDMYAKEAKVALYNAGIKDSYLKDLIDYIAHRDH